MLTGRQLASMGNVDGAVYRVRLNGEPIYVNSATVEASLGEVLDHFESQCVKDAGGLDRIFASLSSNLKAGLDKVDGSARIGVVRQQKGQEGMIACLAQEPLDDLVDLPSRLSRFVESGNLSDVGDLRYVYATATEEGRTHVVSVWTDGDFNLFRVVPRIGEDAPGSDSPNAPRPGEAVRLLSAWVEGAPYGVRVYDSAKAQADVLAMYDAEMPSRGWVSVDKVADNVPWGRAYTREGVDMMVFVSEEKGRTYISVVEMHPR